MLRYLLLSLFALFHVTLSLTSLPFLSTLEFSPSDTLLLHPQFTTHIFSYQILIPDGIKRAFVRPTTNLTNSFVQVRINDGPFIHGDNDQLAISLIDGINHLIIQTGDEDSRLSVATYLVTICNGPNICGMNGRPQDGAQLSHLSLKSIDLHPTFNPRHFFYQCFTSRHIHAAVVAASMRISKDGLIAASMNGEVFDQLIDGKFSEAMPMKIGRNYLFIQARDSRDSLLTYTILIDRGVSDSAAHDKTMEEKAGEIDKIGGMATIGTNSPSTNLVSLVSSAGLFTPRFDQDVTAYRHDVDYHTQSIKLTVVPQDRFARVHLTYFSAVRLVPRAMLLRRAVPSLPIPLETGTNIITLWVTSSDAASTPRAYEINVTRLYEGDDTTANSLGHVHHRPRTSTFNSQHSDPQLVSLLGGKYDVHVEEGEVYNLVSEPHLLVNGRWLACSDADETVLGLSEVGIRTRSGHRIHITSGAGSSSKYSGLARVTLNDEPLHVKDQASIDNSDEEYHEEIQQTSDGSINQSTAELTPFEEHRAKHMHTELVTFNQSNILSFITSTWHISLVDSSRGIEPRVSLIGPLTVGAHGLIGQTYRSKRIGQIHQHGQTDQAIDRHEGSEDSMSLLEGDMLDFRIQDGDLFATKFEFNMYEQE